MENDADTIKQAQILAGRNWAFVEDSGVAYTSDADFCREFIFSVCEMLQTSGSCDHKFVFLREEKKNIGWDHTPKMLYEDVFCESCLARQRVKSRLEERLGPARRRSGGGARGLQGGSTAYAGLVMRHRRLPHVEEFG